MLLVQGQMEGAAAFQQKGRPNRSAEQEWIDHLEC